jgi:hypothetical protein
MSEVQLLLISAISISFLHTVSGPDHYLPFIALSKARGWSLSKTLFWTIACGCGHIGSSLLLGLGGAAIGWSFSKLNWLEQVRGGWAGWGLLLFGFVYSIWGLVSAGKNKRHKHFDSYDDTLYVFEHRHGEAVAPHERRKVTPWVLFIIFLLGPCEPMIPLLFFPAAKNSAGIMILLVGVYTVFTLLTMVAMVMLGYFGLGKLKMNSLERYMHAFGGLTIFVCGAGVVFLEW